MSLLIARDVVAGYGEMEILHQVSLEVQQGEIVTIIGPNGAGKSTLIKTIFGLLATWQGEILFEGQNITRLPPEQIVRRGISYVPQVENIFPSLTVDENLELGAYLRPEAFKRQAEWIYGLFPEIASRRKTPAGRLSGGMRQMVAFGRALMSEPRLLLLDEPSAGLAPMVVDLVFETIQRVNQEGVTILMVEQNARKALACSNRGYILVDGRNRLDGPGQALLADEEIGRLFLGG
ncbi:branched-chain amino acid ABC transporter ATPase [Litorilinea aerophila]|uniref:ABC transporter ATP-binding protein n=2 Tax=Litorilinea aerophila TaxID=1204385 RepID=A0A540V9R8_9CHLR|nr:branched-chain amino acid ABC transporter ATPase [Litorilinea aerophila]